MPKSSGQILDVPKNTRQVPLDTTKLYDFSSFPLRETKGGLIPCPPEQATTHMRFHTYLKTSEAYNVLRFIVTPGAEGTTATKLASFSRKEWAVQYVSRGRLECDSKCNHGKECQQTRPRYNNSSPDLKYCYVIIGRGEISFHKKLSKYTATK